MFSDICPPGPQQAPDKKETFGYRLIMATTRHNVPVQPQVPARETRTLRTERVALSFPNLGVRNKRALTVAEMIAATALLAMLIVATVQVFASMLVVNTKNRASLVALNLATSKLEEVTEQANFATSQSQQALYLNDAAESTQYYIEVTRKPVNGDPLDSGSPYSGGYLFTVQVWWNQSQPGRPKPGAGLQEVSVSKFVYSRPVVP